jgi:hypothetical protein
MIRTATMGIMLTVFLGPGLTSVLEVMHRKMGIQSYDSEDRGGDLSPQNHKDFCLTSVLYLGMEHTPKKRIT